MRFLLLVLLPALLCGATIGSGVRLEGGVTVGADPVSAAYRTVIVLGDTQAHVNSSSGDGTDGGRYNDLKDQIDWIIANKDTENIDFVLHVGDAIDSGTPLPFTGCDSYTGTPLGDFGTCNALIGNQSGCEAETTCGYTTTATPDCAPCFLVDRAETEYGRIETELGRLETAGIPYAFGKGNHDSRGLEYASTTPNGRREPLGYDVDRYDAAHWNSIDSSFTDRAYEYIATNAEPLYSSGHAWDFELDSTPVTVVAIPYMAGLGISHFHHEWLEVMCDIRRDQPLIAIAHEVTEIDTVIIDVSETACPNLIWVAGGHTGNSGTPPGNVKSFVVDGANSVLRTRTDWTNSSRNDTDGVSQDDYFSVVRFYMDESPHEIEAFDYSVGSGFNDSAAGNTITRQDFDLTSPETDAAPFDLAPYSAAIADALVTHAWPNLPVTSTSTTISVGVGDTCANLQDKTNDGATHITIETGVTIGSVGTPCSTASMADDTRLELQGTATIYGHLNGGAGVDRVHISGGFINSNAQYFIGGNDFFVENVVWTGSQDGPVFEANANTDRLALVENTISAGSYTMIFAPYNNVHNDTTVIGNDLTGGTTRDEAVMRIQGGNRTLMLENFFYNDWGLKTGSRFYADNSNSLVMNNAFHTAHRTDTDPVTPVGDAAGSMEFYSTGAQTGDIDHVHVRDNRIFRTGTNYTAPTTILLGDSTDPGGSCDDVLVDGNELITTQLETINVQYSQNGCTNATTTNNTESDLDSAPYNSVIPACGDANMVFSCGADH